MGKFVDLTGRKFERLTVLERSGYVGKEIVWLCVCDCGNTTRVIGKHLKSGHTKSCGCLHIDTAIELGHKNVTHGMKRTRLYRTWASMKNRCLNSKSPNYKDYGGRGITVCEEWLNSFEDFRDWALANGYTDSLSIERIDVNGNYEPSNCTWIPMEAQANNKRQSHYLEFNGVKKTIQQWSNETGLLDTTIHERLKRGWSVEKTLTTSPVK